jgi:ABC-type glutathione transport system ATPase component
MKNVQQLVKMLTIEKLTKSYDRGAIALKDISFAIEPHTFTAILGTEWCWEDNAVALHSPTVAT